MARKFTHYLPEKVPVQMKSFEEYLESNPLPVKSFKEYLSVREQKTLDDHTCQDGQTSGTDWRALLPDS